MNNTSMGQRIATLRKEKGMTQAELAEKMGVTDKAVSKWERDLSCPDISVLPHLAELFGITVDQLMGSGTSVPKTTKSDFSRIIPLILKAMPVAMGVAVTVLSAMKKIAMTDAVSLLGIGLACAGLSLLQKQE
ncbi:MAG: helix-turn-helix domain-containing protein [Oscillospiraceae bacterium]|nr:helix-turn-helix domain-containing protein [Oscillospiraceae bacterium]MBQ7129696.1 helix-turn-helix domain-containing protein [Oscillospiraceae bacterium]